MATAGPLMLVSGLSHDGGAEVYKFFDTELRLVSEYQVDIGAERAYQAEQLAAARPGRPVPFGLESYYALTSYLLHPHSFVQRGQRLVVAMRQAPYLRVLTLAGAEVRAADRWAPEADADYPDTLSGTNSAAAGNGLFVARASGKDRWAAAGPRGTFGGTLVEYDERFATRASYPIPPMVLDSVHQVNASHRDFVVGVDMNLEADLAIDNADGDLPYTTTDADRAVLGEFVAQPFRPSGGFVIDLATGAAHTFAPAHHTAAHVEFDPVDDSVFYVSCHNMIKWRRQLVLRAPAAVYRYRYDGTEVREEGVFTAPNFFRATSECLFTDAAGRSRLAVTNYPGSVYLVDTESMTAVAEIEVVPGPARAAPFVVAKDESAPIFLAYHAATNQLFATSGTHLFELDVDAGKLVRQERFAEADEFLATAHIGMVEPVVTGAQR
jgi:hypothetical protein